MLAAIPRRDSGAHDRVFGLGDDTYGFDVDFIGADSGRATHRTALIEVVDGRISSFEED